MNSTPVTILADRGIKTGRERVQTYHFVSLSNICLLVLCSFLK